MQKDYLDTTARGQAVVRTASPFIPISLGYRIVIIGYVFLSSVLLPGLSETLSSSPTPLAEWRLAAEFSYQALLLLPILFYRSSYGWLHPLIFATVFRLANSLVRNPEQLLAPFFGFTNPLSAEFQNVALWGWSQEEIAWAALKAKTIASIALIAYYLGFFSGLRPRIPHVDFPKPCYVTLKALTAVSLSATAFLLYIQFNEGLTAHISSWGQGRFNARAGEGPIHILIQCGMVASLIWFALDKTAHRNILFWAAVLFSVPVNFFVTGSRSTVMHAVILFLLIWMIRHQKIPRTKIIVTAIVAFLLFGTLGMFRKSTYRGEADWTILTNFDLQQSLAATRDEIDWWEANDGYLPIIAKVPEKVDFLYGESYISALLFFVPRELWPGKPRGVGGMNGEVIFGGGPGAGGVPPGPVGEAYWNFYIPGVLIMFFLYGLFQHWLAQTYMHYARAPAVWILYTITILTFSPTSPAIVGYFHHIIPAIFLLCWMRAISLRSAREVLRHVPA
jgi:oligosaccharide repeat unit polymerase